MCSGASNYATGTGFGRGDGEGLAQNHLTMSVTPRDGNAAVQGGNNNIQQQQLQVDPSILS